MSKQFHVIIWLNLIICSVALPGWAHSIPKPALSARKAAQSQTEVGIQRAYFRGDLIPLSLELMRAAKSGKEILERERQLKKLSVLRSTCETELALKRNPYHCFRIVQIESQIGFVSPQSLRGTLGFLSELCRPAEFESSILNAEERKSLSAGCLRALQTSETRQKYSLSETQPTRRFDARFQEPKTRLEAVTAPLAGVDTNRLK